MTIFLDPQMCNVESFKAHSETKPTDPCTCPDVPDVTCKVLESSRIPWGLLFCHWHNQTIDLLAIPAGTTHMQQVGCCMLAVITYLPPI
jgi:hypothetical protein